MVASLVRENVMSTLFAVTVALLLFPFVLYAVFADDDEQPEEVEIEVCDDCAMMSANGSHGWEYDESWLNAYVAQADALGDPILTHDESHFSMSPCEFCGSRLGGNRHRAVVVVG